MASAVITPIADRLKALLAGLDVTPPVTAYRWTPQRLGGTGPFAVVELPRVERSQVNDPEEELGNDDWVITYPVVLYVDLKDPDRDQERIVELLEAFTAAVDDNRGLKVDDDDDATIIDTRVVTSDPSVDLIGESRPVLAYECEVAVFKHVPY
jgi:hypothetical protein